MTPGSFQLRHWLLVVLYRYFPPLDSVILYWALSCSQPVIVNAAR